MPTQAEFELAANQLEAAAAEVASLAASAAATDARSIVRGGSLGVLVPQRIGAAAAAAAGCESAILAVAATCRERAAIIADYLVQLTYYDAAYSNYRIAITKWSMNMAAYENDVTGYARWPGSRPRPPTPPPTPPAWADVRRP